MSSTCVFFCFCFFNMLNVVNVQYVPVGMKHGGTACRVNVFKCECVHVTFFFVTGPEERLDDGNQCI